MDVACDKCRTTLFSYKKKNGTKSNLVKMFVERICKDPYDIIKEKTSEEKSEESNQHASFDYTCPKCNTCFGRDAFIKGLPAIKVVGSRLRMK